MSLFESACERAGTPLEGRWSAGLGALTGPHSACVRARRPRKITGSVDVDGALESLEPNSTRWDYGVGYVHEDGTERAHWIEVHPATDKEVRAVLSKLDWLKAFLRDTAPGLLGITESTADAPAYVWVHTGYYRLRPRGPARRRLAEAGLKGPVRELELP